MSENSKPAGAPEISEEMLSAGETILREALGGSVESFWDPRDLAREVYLAMFLQSLLTHQDDKRVLIGIAAPDSVVLLPSGKPIRIGSAGIGWGDYLAAKGKLRHQRKK